jgi:hypothetical protein
LSIETKELPIDKAPDMASYMEARKKGLTAIPAESAAPAAAQEQEPSEATETAPETGSASETEQNGGKPKQKGGFQRRIDKLTAQVRSLQEENSRLKTKPSTEQQLSEQPKEDKKPARENFTSEAEFHEALGRWSAREELRAKDAAEEQRQKQESDQEIVKAHTQRLEDARKSHEDFDDVIEDSGIEVSREAALAIYQLENGPEVMYHLATHPDDADILREMSPIRQIAALGHISASLGSAERSQPPPKTKSRAPAPIKPGGAAPSKSSVPLDQMANIHDYMKARQAGRTR